MKKTISIGIQGFSEGAGLFFCRKNKFYKRMVGKSGCCNIDHTPAPLW